MKVILVTGLAGFTGSNWPNHDGSFLRDHVDVIDLKEGHLKGLKYLFKNKPQIFNLNLVLELGRNVLDLIKAFEIVNNSSIPYLFSE